METMFIPHSDYLEHHGIKGQKWGLRRYANIPIHTEYYYVSN